MSMLERLLLTQMARAKREVDKNGSPRVWSPGFSRRNSRIANDRGEVATVSAQTLPPAEAGTPNDKRESFMQALSRQILIGSSAEFWTPPDRSEKLAARETINCHFGYGGSVDSRNLDRRR
jgi:hypothetical protein